MSSASRPPADPVRIGALLEALARWGGDGPGISRIAFSDADAGARRLLTDEARALGLTATVDQFANLHFTLPGRDQALAPLGVGSHADTVPAGGNLDGAAGIVVGLEVARLLAGAGLRHPLRVVDFTGEEAGPFGVSTIGSRGLAGTLSERELALTDAQGRVLADRLEATVEAAGLPLLESPAFSAFVEVHIEQGHRLDTAGRSLGVVAGITAIRRTQLHVEGEANHAGTTIRSRRRDALLATAEMLAAAESIWEEADPEEAAAVTFGSLDVEPNAITVIPARVTTMLEIRSPDAGLVGLIDAETQRRMVGIARRRGVALRSEQVLDQPPRAFDAAVIGHLLAGCGAVEPDPPLLWSLAGHDAGHMAGICPAGMVFVRSLGGVSHAPAEHSDPADLARAADAVAAALVRIDTEVDT